MGGPGRGRGERQQPAGEGRALCSHGLAASCCRLPLGEHANIRPAQHIKSFHGEEYILEVKYDGERIHMHKVSGGGRAFLARLCWTRARTDHCLATRTETISSTLAGTTRTLQGATTQTTPGAATRRTLRQTCTGP